MVLDAPYPEDGRVTKEAVALMRAGHHVCLLCVRRPGEPARETVGGVAVTRITRGVSLFAKTAWDSITALTWRHPVFAWALGDFARAEHLDALHVHDLPLAGTVAAAAKTAGILWVLDLHENYPAGLQTWFSHKTNPIVKLKNRAVMTYDRWLAYEGRMVRSATAVITVVEEMRSRVCAVHGVPPARVAVVTNSEWRDFFEQFPELPEVSQAYPGEYVLLYLGYYGPHRGLDTVIEAMPTILYSIPEARFVVIGRGSIRADLEALSERVGVRDRVDFRGVVPYAEVGSWMRRADVNVVPHLRNEHNDHTVPHKLFQNMLSGQPTVVSSAPPLARIAVETGGARVYEAGHKGELARVIIELHGDLASARATATKGLAATRHGDYNWDTDQANLTSVYADMCWTGPKE